MSSAAEKVLRRRLIQRPADPGFRQTLYDVIFEADTPLGRGFDVGLLVAIITSIVLVALETVPEYELQLDNESGQPASSLAKAFWVAEWALTILFTIEYGLRLYCVRHPLKYAFSFWGVVDLLSILPGYLTLYVEYSAKSFVILRSIRLLRVFRVLKLWRMMSQADELADAVWKSREKIIVFLAVVLVAVTISGTLMYQIETVLMGKYHESDFTSIPQAMYWAIVTMTTVGYGDVVPHTTIGKIISAVLILLGYSLIIVPTGFVSAELSGRGQTATEHHRCAQCGLMRHRETADYCDRCGHRLDEALPTQDNGELLQ
ncbi:ion transporter [Rhodopirellula sp. JC740]|uniref:Ion transporter n=1 Tax=Rhodopirellula halodulae TaxID=2894198 RepID=A0ABS8NNZ5_9BACT|nr:ion transporter [Rhodopirellula sp. JC740]MCC9645288.1 ion transporter [Rhodopirellula sp. JC740]